MLTTFSFEVKMYFLSYGFAIFIILDPKKTNIFFTEIMLILKIKIVYIITCINI
jgi:hypothetical protein